MEYLVEASTEKLRKFEDLFNHAPCGYHTLDSNGVFIEINDTELHWLGYRREQLIGQAEFIRLLTPGSRKTFEANFAGLKSDGSFDDLDLELLRKDRTVLHATLSATAVKDERGMGWTRKTKNGSEAPSKVVLSDTHSSGGIIAF